MKKIFIIFLLVLSCDLPITYKRSVVVDKTFTKGQYSSGFGMSTGGHAVIINTSTSDDFCILLENGDYFSVDSKTYIKTNVGDSVITKMQGIFLVERKIYSKTLTKKEEK